MQSPRRRTFRRPSCAAWLIILLQILHPLNLHASVADRSVGILGGLGTVGDGERTYEILEKRLQRWLEDTVHQQVRVSTVAGSESEHRAQLELERLQLQQAAEELLLKPATGDSTKVTGLVDRLSSVESFGPELQLAFVALSLSALALGDEKKSLALVRRAKQLHPEGKLAAVLPWTWDKNTQRSDLESMWTSIDDNTRSCRLNWAAPEAATVVRLNGFEVLRPEINVVPGRSYTLSVSKGDQILATQTVSCSRSGDRSVRLENGAVLAWGWNEARKLALGNISQRHSVATLLVLDRAGEEYNIYVFTPGLGLDRVPTEKPLRADTIRASQRLPIAWESLQRLLEKHQHQAPRLVLSDAPANFEWATKSPETAVPAWYERSSTWVIAGAIVAGVAVAVAASRSKNSVQSSPGFAIRLD